MINRGKTISIWIPDGNPRSIRISEINNSIVKAFFIPRNKLSEISKIDKDGQLNNPGLYFLIGEKNDAGKVRVYIGESENILKRIKQHNQSKDFWNSAICFISEKGNINKAHIKFLENYVCNEAKRINKSELENNINPTQSKIKPQEEDFILSFFDDLKVLIASLGYPIFEESKKNEKDLLYCKGKDAFATGEYSEDGLLVFSKSKANLKESNSVNPGVVSIRKKLINQNILKQEGDVLVFIEDYLFNSPSASAAVILARRANGWTEWKDKKGKTMDEKFRKNI